MSVESVTVMVQSAAAADVIEDAADLLRARAAAAKPGPWAHSTVLRGHVYHQGQDVAVCAPEDAEHVAALDPDVARALAAVLDKEAADLRLPAYSGHAIPHTHPMLHLALTYLRKDPTRP